MTELTNEKFSEIYTDEKFRNQVAGAHPHHDRHGKFIAFKTCSYPVSYSVTEEQITEANIELIRRKNEVIKASKNKLVFVGMGMTFPPRFEDDICNHRVRATFVNTKGLLFFLEVSTDSRDGKDSMIVNHAIYITKDFFGNEINNHNYQRLEIALSYPKYTLDNLRSFVNNKFQCKFTEIIIDNYNLNPDDCISISPKD